MTYEINNITNNIYQYLTKFRIATRRQITVICGDTAATEEALAAMIRLRRIGQKTMEVTPGKYADVLYLKAAGIKPATAANPKIAHLIRIGLPKNSMLKRVYHELLVVEALCWYKNFTDVFDFYVEDELKSRGETAADLRVHLCDENGELSSADCEIVVKNSTKQIANKSRDLIFFTPNQTRADRIEYEKKCSVIVIDIIFNPPLEKIQNTVDHAVEERCLDVLSRLGSALTAAALATFVEFDRARISATMNSSFGVYQAECRIDLDASAGRPEKLFYSNLNNLDSYSDRVFYLLLSRLLEKSSGWYIQLERININERAILYKNDSKHVLFYVDDPMINLIDSLGKYALIWDDVEQHGEMITYFIPSNSARYFETLSLMSDIRLADLVFARDFKF